MEATLVKISERFGVTAGEALDFIVHLVRVKHVSFQRAGEKILAQPEGKRWRDVKRHVSDLAFALHCGRLSVATTTAAATTAT